MKCWELRAVSGDRAVRSEPGAVKEFPGCSQELTPDRNRPLYRYLRDGVKSAVRSELLTDTKNPPCGSLDYLLSGDDKWRV